MNQRPVIEPASPIADAPSRVPASRRDWLRMAALTVAAGTTGHRAWAQPVSEMAAEAKAPPVPPVGSELKVPRITLLDGSEFDPTQASGKPLLVYWWSSTCPFCALQSPAMDKFWKAHKGQNGLMMLALSIDKKPEAAVAYLKGHGYSFPSAWASPEWRKAFPKPKGLPITLLRGVDGKLILAEKGQMFDEDVQAMGSLL